MRLLLLITALLLAATRPGVAGSPIGVWARDGGATKVVINQCPSGFCGRITRLMPNSRAKIGQQVLSGMRPTGPNSWTGTAVNPEDGKRYTGKMLLNGDSLTVSGCVLGGVICKDVLWNRSM